MTPTPIDDSQRVVPVDLLPCPFCNAEPAYFSGTNIQYGHGESSDYAGVRCSVCRVEISFCNYAGYQLTERMALAAEKWNRRAAAPVAEPETGVFRLKRREFDPFDPHIQAALIALGWKSPDSATASPPATPEARRDGDRVGPDDVLWVVNDMGELGVKIHGRCFFLYKGESLEYADGTGHDDGTPTLYREVGKREFGETVWPQAWIKAGRSEARYVLELVHTPGLSDGEPGDPRYQWAPLPVVAAIDAAQADHEGV